MDIFTLLADIGEPRTTLTTIDSSDVQEATAISPFSTNDILVDEERSGGMIIALCVIA